MFKLSSKKRRKKSGAKRTRFVGPISGIDLLKSANLNRKKWKRSRTNSWIYCERKSGTGSCHAQLWMVKCIMPHGFGLC